MEQKYLAKAKEALNRGMSLVKERQKMILLADKSSFGWKTVLEYKHHDLTDDEEEEKKILQCRSSGSQGFEAFRYA